MINQVPRQAQCLESAVVEERVCEALSATRFDPVFCFGIIIFFLKKYSVFGLCTVKDERVQTDVDLEQLGQIERRLVAEVVPCFFHPAL